MIETNIHCTVSAMKFDLTTGQISGSISGVTPVVPLSGPGHDCSLQAVYKVHFDLSGGPQLLQNLKLKVEMTFKTPYQYVFNIGDSETNDGWGKSLVY